MKLKRTLVQMIRPFLNYLQQSILFILITHFQLQICVPLLKQSFWPEFAAGLSKERRAICMFPFVVRTYVLLTDPLSPSAFQEKFLDDLFINLFLCTASQRCTSWCFKLTEFIFYSTCRTAGRGDHTQHSSHPFSHKIHTASCTVSASYPGHQCRQPGQEQYCCWFLH